MTETAPPRATIRIDKWLWQARFYKSRTLASEAVSGGRMRVNGVPSPKPSRTVGAGDVLTFAQGEVVRVIRVLDCGLRRGPASESRTLYEDLSPAATTGADPARPFPLE